MRAAKSCLASSCSIACRLRGGLLREDVRGLLAVMLLYVSIEKRYRGAPTASSGMASTACLTVFTAKESHTKKYDSPA